MQEAVFRDFAAWREKSATTRLLEKQAQRMSRRSSSSLTASAYFVDGEIVSEIENQEYIDYASPFVEWLADQVANAMVKRQVDGTSSTTRLFMRKVASAIQRFYDKLATNGKYRDYWVLEISVAPSVETFLDSLRTKDGDNGATVELNSETGTFSLSTAPKQTTLFSKTASPSTKRSTARAVDGTSADNEKKNPVFPDLPGRQNTSPSANIPLKVITSTDGGRHSKR